ncbi:MAG: glycosyltransferase involved in cell wall biosynthesis [Myxococcota bacterium]|jgi:glycosyltransferase involved in cell wall biosynthesis
MEVTEPKRVLFVQGGHYAQAFNRFRAGGDETFFAQKYSVDFVGELAERDDVDEVVQLCTTRDLDEQTLDNGVRQLGINQWPAGSPTRTNELVALALSLKPTHMITNTPTTALIRAARKAGIEIFPLLADSFRVAGLKAKLRYWWLAHNLRHRDIRWVANRNLKASQDLERIGIQGSKIVPFDWPAVITPEDFAPKTKAVDATVPNLLYVGQVIVGKGVGDLVDAVARLKSAGVQCRLTIIGNGDIDSFRKQAAQSGVSDNVAFMGTLPHTEVLAAMHRSDVVLVPSRHEYPEGMPNVIYEGLCTHTPLIVSDHPMFETRVKNGKDCLVFPAGNIDELVAAITRLFDEPALYAALASNAEEACANYLNGAPWGELIEHWLGGTAADDAWLAERSLASPRFRS